VGVTVGEFWAGVGGAGVTVGASECVWDGVDEEQVGGCVPDKGWEGGPVVPCTCLAPLPNPAAGCVGAGTLCRPAVRTRRAAPCPPTH